LTVSIIFRQKIGETQAKFYGKGQEKKFCLSSPHFSSVASWRSSLIKTTEKFEGIGSQPFEAKLREK
jgi:hypothetical protein